ncbi:acetylornithine transaminase [Tsukamurella tyrosinosolvens]|uniref:acetylornithine transaminase n=1 Tax=Tsukamurella tyrosinosolvens TaxID=57704 RepID=UPI000798B5AC|nr:acetylornithine transaminase [Tsukamurella tyrosinosolvens]KXP08031.1 acetylornithine aminotransferase [Tsukamurella tyrosinosolvens]KZL97410.1 acetylornithine aminotransferase [Tsukamurella tyrosinosolvens]MCA4996012.1 acetylornithine transaminase [Tsukamurella tyrosinosolvens]WEL91693.1 acetylornithine transaminase [Tsukamurella tyrosinosolvens]
MSNEAMQSRWNAAVMDTYGTPPIALVSGRGATVTDADGKEYVDLLGGIAVNALGHAHPKIIEAVTQQVSTLGHVSNLYISEPVVRLAERLTEAVGVPGTRVFFSNSGAEANEAAIKIGRRTGRTAMVAADGAFHGRTMGSLALTGQPAKREPFAPLIESVTHVPYGDAAALRAAAEGAAAIFLEPIMGEGGVVVPPAGYLAEARAAATEASALLVFDEVQTGIARTGTLFAYQRAGVTPDVFTLAKGLGGGLPIGATVAVGAAGELLTPGQHGTTFGGNPVAAAAANAVLDVIEAEGLAERADALGKHIAATVEGFGHPLVTGVRGSGLLLGITLSRGVAKAIETGARDAGFLLNAAQPDVVRLAPPLVLTDEQADRFLTALPALLDSAQEQS